MEAVHNSRNVIKILNNSGPELEAEVYFAIGCEIESE
jgi:hypothetical protein